MSKDITQRLRDYARYYTTTTYQDDLIREAVTEIESLRQQVTLLRGLLTRYRNETPVGNQPHMICNEVDEALTATEPKP